MFRLGDAVSQIGSTFFVSVALIIFVSIFAGVLFYTFFMLSGESANELAHIPLKPDSASGTVFPQAVSQGEQDVEK